METSTLVNLGKYSDITDRALAIVCIFPAFLYHSFYLAKSFFTSFSHVAVPVLLSWPLPFSKGNSQAIRGCKSREMTPIGINWSLDGSAPRQTASANVKRTRDTGRSLVSRRKHLAILSEVTNKLHHKQDWIKKRSRHYVSSIYMLKVFGGKDQISNYNLLMHSPVGSGTLMRKKDWVKDLRTFSSIYFIGKWTLTISKARDYALFSLCILFSFSKV